MLFNYIDIENGQIQLQLISNSANIELDIKFVEFRSYLLSISYKYIYFKFNELVLLILGAFKMFSIIFMLINNYWIE